MRRDAPSIPGERRQDLDMRRLREEVETLDTSQPVASIRKPCEIARQGGRIAREIHDPSGIEARHPLQE